MTTATYWLYNGRQPIAAIRWPAGASDAEVRAAALVEHWRNPCCFGDWPWLTPFEHAERIRVATVCTFP